MTTTDLRNSFAVERCAAWDGMHRRYFPDYDERWDQTIATLRGAVRTPERGPSRDAVDPEPRVLDLGCGPGTLTARLAAGLRSTGVIGIDRDPLLVELAQAAHGGSAEFLRIDALSPEARDLLAVFGPFDAIVSSAFVHYFSPGQLRDLHELCTALLKPEGLLVTAERFALPRTAAPRPAPSPAAPPHARPHPTSDAWREWWRETDAAARMHGFTPATVNPSSTDEATQDGPEPEPLAFDAYLRVLADAGLALTATSLLTGGSMVVVARHG